MKEIFHILSTLELYGGDELVQIAKGKYNRPKTFRGWINKLMRDFRVEKIKQKK